MNDSVLLSFDVEEFDIPLEYNQAIEENDQYTISHQGLIRVINILDQLELRATFFVTAQFALRYPQLIQSISKRHEIASHGFYHSSFEPDHLKKSKETIESIIGKSIYGFRMPRLKTLPSNLIREAGYSYDSSINPTYIPGRYNHFFSQRTIHFVNGICIIPTSVTPISRFPLFWISFKMIPLWLFKWFTIRNLKTDQYVTLYFHPWEFSDLKDCKLPIYVKRLAGEKLSKRLVAYLHWLKKRKTSFKTYYEFYLERKKS